MSLLNKEKTLRLIRGPLIVLDYIGNLLLLYVHCVSETKGHYAVKFRTRISLQVITRSLPKQLEHHNRQHFFFHAFYMCSLRCLICISLRLSAKYTAEFSRLHRMTTMGIDGSASYLFQNVAKIRALFPLRDLEVTVLITTIND